MLNGCERRHALFGRVSCFLYSASGDSYGLQMSAENGRLRSFFFCMTSCRCGGRKEMLFNSLTFMLFLPVVFAGYWLIYYPKKDETVSSTRLWLQNMSIVVASYVFYGWWNWRFLLLISFTSLWAWKSGLMIDAIATRDTTTGLDQDSESPKRTKEKAVVAGALVVNLGILGVFKYYNFFLDNVVSLLSAIGFHPHPSSLEIILPVGISFYTFQALSYVIDVYRKNIKPTRDVVAFLAFVSFFPQLVAGPIERATNLLPQFLKPRHFDYSLAVDGCRQMLWGFFKKVVIADSCARAANMILGNPNPSSISLWIGMLCFTFQIYGDFSGYSDIAIGCSKLFGIRLMRNFNMPYFSRDIAEFWRRWHISLTTWFRDYLYIPLGGSRCGKCKIIRNTFAIFLVSGFWHGANWTFIAWGLFHAMCFLPLLLCGRNRKYVADFVAQGRNIPSLHEVISMLSTFMIVVVGWTLFRAPNIATAYSWLSKMLTFSDLSIRQCGLGWTKNAILPLAVLIFVEWFNRGRQIPALPQRQVLRWLIYIIMFGFILLCKAEPQEFIYFQF